MPFQFHQLKEATVRYETESEIQTGFRILEEIQFPKVPYVYIQAEMH